jgi:hypothetical protein
MVAPPDSFDKLEFICTSFRENPSEYAYEKTFSNKFSKKKNYWNKLDNFFQKLFTWVMGPTDMKREQYDSYRQHN